ncbi:MAG TPA: ATP-binding protein [Longimicrobium sp.]
MSPSAQAPAREHDARFGATRDGVCVLSPDWRIRYMNASMLEILRLIGREEGIQTLWDALPGWERTPAADRLREAMESDRPQRFRVDGERGAGRVWEVEAEPLETGELRVRLRNVTAEARAQQAEERFREATVSLAEREERLEGIVAGAPVGIVLLDADTFTVREANEFYHQFLEGEWRRPGAIVGHATPEFIPDWHAAGLQETFERVRDSGQAFEISEFEFHGFARGTTYFRFTLQPIPAGPRPRYLLLMVVEITEQVLARRRAEAERRALYDVLATLPVGVLVAEAPSGRTTYLNPAGAALGGRSADELTAAEVGEYTARWRICRPTGEPYPPGELPIARALRGETTRDAEMVLRLPDGAERTVLVSGVPLLDAEGRVDRGMVVFYDLTDRLRLERALLERSRELEAAAAEAALRAEESRALREIGRALVSELEPDRVLQMAAGYARELLGARGSSVCLLLPGGQEFRVSPALGTLGQLDGTVFPYPGSVMEQVVADDEPILYNAVDEVRPTSPVLPLVRRLRLRNLLFVPLRAFGRTLGVLNAVDREEPFGPEQVRLLSALADSVALAIHNAGAFAAERRRAEENRALLAAAEALTSTLDADEVTRRIATIACDLTRADGAGLTLLSGERGERSQMMAAVGMLEPMAGAESPSAGSLTELVTRGGRPLLLSLSELDDAVTSRGALTALGAEHGAVVPVRAGDDVVGLLGVVRTADTGPFSDDDLRVLSLLADQAALAVRNARLYESARSASRAKSEFLAMMSHELRTPLNALEGYASLLEEGIYGPVNEAQMRALDRMRVSRRHLMALIDKVLDLARVEAGTRRPELEVVEVDALVEQVAEAMRGAAEAKGLALEMEAGGAGRLRTDAGLVRQILTNLLGNSIKFTEAGAVRVRTRREGETVTVEVEDTGPGIAPQHQDRVFEAFFQVDPSTTRKEGGTGLGLALSRDFARLLGGEITLRSTPGEGSTFALQLPVGESA